MLSIKKALRFDALHFGETTQADEAGNKGYVNISINQLFPASMVDE